MLYTLFHESCSSQEQDTRYLIQCPAPAPTLAHRLLLMLTTWRQAGSCSVLIAVSSIEGLHSRKSSGGPKGNDGCSAHGTCFIKGARLGFVVFAYDLLDLEPCRKPKGCLRTAQRLQHPGQGVGKPGLLLAWSLPSYRAIILWALSSSA